MFPPPSYIGAQPIGRTGWTMTQVDEMDIHLFNDVMEIELTDEPTQEKEVYLSELW